MIKAIFLFLLIYMYIALSDLDVFADYDYVEAKIYNHEPYLRIKSSIGIKSQNRINFSNYGIREIIGDDTQYQIIHDSQGNNIFLIPKVLVGEIIEITLVSNSNKVQDLSLEVIDDFGQTIVICTEQSNEK